MTSAALGTTHQAQHLRRHDRPRDQARHPERRRHHAARQGRDPPAWHRARRPIVHASVLTPTRLDRRAGGAAAPARRDARRGALGRPAHAGQPRPVRQAARRVPRQVAAVTAPLFFLDAGQLDGAATGSHGGALRCGGTACRDGAADRRRRERAVADGTGLRASAVVQRVDRDELQLVVQSLERGARRRARASCWSRRWPRATATSRRSRRPPSSASTRWCRGRPSAASSSGVVSGRAKAHRKWQSVVLAAAKQSRRPTVPTVAPAADRRAVVDLVGRASLALVLHEDAGTALASVPLPADGDVAAGRRPRGGHQPRRARRVRRRGRAQRPARRHGPALLQRRAGRPRGPQRRRPVAMT